MYINMCKCVSVSISECVRVSVCIYIYMYFHLYINLYIYIVQFIGNIYLTLRFVYFNFYYWSIIYLLPPLSLFPYFADGPYVVQTAIVRGMRSDFSVSLRFIEAHFNAHQSTYSKHTATSVTHNHVPSDSYTSDNPFQPPKLSLLRMWKVI